MDLERRQPVDLLPDRESVTLEQWLKLHPSIEIVSRDRSTSYAEGIRQGAPNAAQLANRWHLLKNLGEALERLLNRYSQSLTKAVEIINHVAGPPPIPQRQITADNLAAAIERAVTNARMRERAAALGEKLRA